MLWNWYTIDACFLSSTWHITSHGMFAGSCIGVIGLVSLLEFLRRLQREYERSIQPQPQRQPASTNDDVHTSNPSKVDSNGSTSSNDGVDMERRPPLTLGGSRYVPSLRQQVVRAAIHTTQFAVAYIIMLLAMYYNGFIIICIFIGIFIGFMIFGWDAAGVPSM